MTGSDILFVAELVQKVQANERGNKLKCDGCLANIKRVKG
jgi:hypothetical protein